MKRFLLAIISGLLFTLSWPTYGMPILLFFAFVPLLYLERDIRLKISKLKSLKLFGLSYLSFVIWNFFTTNWLGFADVFGASFAILVNSLLMTLVILLYHAAAKRTSAIKSQIYFVTLWISFEFLHLNWEFSWPWLNLGNAFSEYHSWIQWYEYTGAFGGTLWVLLINLFVFTNLIGHKIIDRKVLTRHVLMLLLFIVVPIFISHLIYIGYMSKGKSVGVVILQPNIDPYTQKYDTPNSEISDLFIQLAGDKVNDSTDFVIAPETVFAQNVRQDRYETSLFKYKLDKFIEVHPNLNILTGVSFIEFITDKKYIKSETNHLRDSIWYNDFNSAVLLNATGISQIYHKSKLVVGVEDFPYQSVLKPILGDAMIDLGGTIAMKTTQKTRSALKSSNGEYLVAPIICYESVYGEYVTGYIRNGANFLAIITNDAWWKNTQGHKQHLSYAKLRAIETRRFIARSANTGISAIINDRGDILSSLAYDKKGALEGTLQTNDKVTFYVIAGDYIARISVFIMLLLGLITFFRKPRIKRRL